MSGIIDELEFNFQIGNKEGIQCPFEIRQFQQCISDGILSLLDEDLRNAIMSAYAHIKTANYELDTHSNRDPVERATSYNLGTLNVKSVAATNEIKNALDQIKKFLSKN